MRKPFTPEQDKRITESFADYEVTMKDLAERFGCTPSAISHAVKRHLNVLLRGHARSIPINITVTTEEHR